MQLFNRDSRFHFLQPLAYMFKDFKDTFKPYKSPFYLEEDLLQAANGVMNIIDGVYNIGKGLFSLKGMQFSLGMTQTFRGIIQFVTTPLNWLIRIPFRGLLTAVTGFQKAEDGNGIQRNLEKAINLFEKLEAYNQWLVSPQMTTPLILQTMQTANEQDLDKKQIAKKIASQTEEISLIINAKYDKALNKGQPTDIKIKRPLGAREKIDFDSPAFYQSGFDTERFITDLKLFDKHNKINHKICRMIVGLPQKAEHQSEHLYHLMKI